MTGTNCGLSPRCPAVATIDNGFVPLLAAQVQLRGQPTTGTAQRVIARLVGHPTGWLGLQVAVRAGTGSVLVRPGTGGVHADIPGDLAGRVGDGLQRGQDPLPGAIALPPAKQRVDRRPGAVVGRNVPPRSTNPDTPPHPVDQPAFIPQRRSPRPLARRQQRFQRCPLRVGEVEPCRHRYPVHEVSVLMVVLVDEPSTGDLTYFRSPTRRQHVPPGHTPPPTSTHDLGREERTVVAWCQQPLADAGTLARRNRRAFLFWIPS